MRSLLSSHHHVGCSSKFNFHFLSKVWGWIRITPRNMTLDTQRNLISRTKVRRFHSMARGRELSRTWRDRQRQVWTWGGGGLYYTAPCRSILHSPYGSSTACMDSEEMTARQKRITLVCLASQLFVLRLPTLDQGLIYLNFLLSSAYPWTLWHVHDLCCLSAVLPHRATHNLQRLDQGCRRPRVAMGGAVGWG